VRWQGTWTDERGFTLIEMTIVITLMGLLFAIATTTFFKTIESRQVDSATNQVAADMRLASTSASNRLVPWQVVFTTGNLNYQLVKESTPAVTTTRWLPDGTKIASTTTVEFATDGSATVISGSGSPIHIQSTDGNPQLNVEFNTQTSRVQIVPVS
jgi:prepilin-type N-terminal cleavage/methylation domain-containing protein